MHLGEGFLRLLELLLFQLVFFSLLIIVCGCDTRCIITDNNLDVLVLNFLLQVLELQLAKKGLKKRCEDLG